MEQEQRIKDLEVILESHQQRLFVIEGLLDSNLHSIENTLKSLNTHILEHHNQTSLFDKT